MTPRLAMLSCLAVSFSLPALAQTPASLPRSDGAVTPVLVYGGAASACPRTMIVSHGLGGSERGLPQLAEAMARDGWRVIVMGHGESGRDALREAFRETRGIRAAFEQVVTDPDAYRGRLLDLDAAHAEATRRCRPPQLVLAGHSMGAATTMLEAGSVARVGRFGRDRFDAYVAISPQGVGKLYADGAWSAVAKPVLMITGTRDRGRDGDWRTRISAFEQLPPGRKRFIVIPDATHLELGGRGAPSVSQMVAAATREFLAGVATRGSLPRSRLDGVDVQDK